MTAETTRRGLIGVTCALLAAFGCHKGGASNQPAVDKTSAGLRPAFAMDAVCGPDFANVQLQPGTFADVERTMKELKPLDLSASLDRICRKDITLRALSWGIYDSAMRRLAAGREADALALLALAADDYANPMAQVRLARLYHKGAQAGGLKEGPGPDLARSYEYLAAAEASGEALRDDGAMGKSLLQPLVAASMSLKNAFHTLQETKAFKASPEVTRGVAERTAHYQALYRTAGPYTGRTRAVHTSGWAPRTASPK